MKRWVLRLSVFVVALAIAFLAPIQALAQDTNSQQFETSLETIYDVQDSGTTSVKHSFSARNLQPTTYLKEYTLSTNFPNLQNVKAESNKQDLSPQVSTDGNKTIIKVSFPDQVVGQNKVRQFSVSYDIPNMAVVAGQVLEVQIPPIVSQEPYKQHTVILKTPLRFGRAIRMNPPSSAVILENNQIITTLDQTEPTPISAYFGDRQVFSMTLRYNLENNGSAKSIAQIALPPDTSFQKVNYVSLDPYPNEIKQDVDGNWIGTYELNPNSATSVYLTANVLVTLDPMPDVPVLQPQSFHTKEAKYWETNSSEIKKAMEGKSSIEDLYQYVVKSLNYSYDIVNDSAINRRLGAVESLKKPNAAVCQEFTDTFIALARAAGTPARRLTGYAYTQNPSLRPVNLDQDILHAWPEYFDTEKNLWHPVDPTWESTTGGIDYFNNFDLNHVVFAINGESSTTPYPAGSYKGSDLNTKDVEVGFANSFPPVEANLSIEFQPQKAVAYNIPGRYDLVIINNTGQAWYDVSVELQTDDSGIELQPAQVTLPVILPFEHHRVPLAMYQQNWRPNASTTVNYTYVIREQTTKDNQGSAELQTAPEWGKLVTSRNIFIAVGGCAAILILGAGGLLVLGRRRKRSVRR